MTLRTARPRVVGLYLFGGLIVGVIVLTGLGLPPGNRHPAHGPMAPSHHQSYAEADEPTHGFTAGWLNGQTVQFFYVKDFFCEPPPASGAPSQCEVGEDGAVDPRPGPIPTLFVMTPLGFRPDAATLHCPVVGSCINHPATIDLSRIGGPADAPLPAHSHIIDERHGGWWELVVIGVKSPGVWNQIVAGKNLDTVRALQSVDPTGETITADISTNTYLNFNVRP